MRSFLNLIYYTAFIIIVALTLLLLSTFFPFKDWYQVKVVLSGSMEPTIPVGSVVVIKSDTNYIVGDVITFGPDTKEQIPVTHRIVGEQIEDGKTKFVTKGDANEGSDAGFIEQKAIIGKVKMHIPYFGYFLDFTKTPIGFWSLVIVPSVMLILIEFIKAIRSFFSVKQDFVGKQKNS